MVFMMKGELSGLVYPYAEDFNSAGTKKFHSRVTDPLQKRFTVREKDEKLLRSIG